MRVLDDAPIVWLFVAGPPIVLVGLATFGSISGGKPGQLYPSLAQEWPYRARPHRIAADCIDGARQAEHGSPISLEADWLARGPRPAGRSRRWRPEARRHARSVAAVRNSLMGHSLSRTSISQRRRFRPTWCVLAMAGLHPVPTGIEHGTVTVVADHVPFEVTTLRKDIETFGRHAASPSPTTGPRMHAGATSR